MKRGASWSPRRTATRPRTGREPARRRQFPPGPGGPLSDRRRRRSAADPGRPSAAAVSRGGLVQELCALRPRPAAGAVAVNLLVDNDILQSAAVRVPGGDDRQPRIEAVPFDEPAYAIPYEERRCGIPPCSRRSATVSLRMVAGTCRRRSCVSCGRWSGRGPPDGEHRPLPGRGPPPAGRRVGQHTLEVR